MDRDADPPEGVREYRARERGTLAADCRRRLGRSAGAARVVDPAPVSSGARLGHHPGDRALAAVLAAGEGVFPRGHRILAPLVLTLLVGLVLIVPLLYVAFELARESGSFVRYIGEVRDSGLPMPPWLPRLPGVGYQIAGWWQANLSDPQMIHELFGRIFTRIPAESASRLGGEVAHRLIIFGFTLLTLFFLFRDGAALSRQLLGLSHRVLGPRGEQVARHMIAAVHGTVTGLVLVGLAEGVLLGFAYVLAGLPHPVSIAALTGVLAVIPFGAPVAFCAAGLYLLAQGSTVAAATVVGFGFLVVFVADHFVRPFLIGGAARLPFLWVLLGILGGLETFGLLGLFLGPVVMAALVSLWREWINTPEPSKELSAVAPPQSRPEP